MGNQEWVWSTTNCWIKWSARLMCIIAFFSCPLPGIAIFCIYFVTLNRCFQIPRRLNSRKYCNSFLKKSHKLLPLYYMDTFLVFVKHFSSWNILHTVSAQCVWKKIIIFYFHIDIYYERVYKDCQRFSV